MTKKCSQCGICCRLFLINLSEKEYRSGKYKTQFVEFGLVPDFSKAITCGANLLKQRKNGSCIYLKNNLCSIHEIRPQVCRNFFCASGLKKHKNMIKAIDEKRVSLKKKTG